MRPNDHELRLGFEQCLHEPRAYGLPNPVSHLRNNESDAHLAIRSILNLGHGPVRYPRNKVISLEGDPADYIIIVGEGVLRTCRAFKDGHRTIVAFHVSGEIVGFTDEPTHALCIEASTNSTVLLLNRTSVRTLAARDNRVANFLLANTARELRRLQEHSVLINRRAQCRVATFLIDLSVRLGKARCLDLPMSHQDIADFLGLAIETLSRVITEFERAKFISRVSAQTLVLTNRESLIRIMD
jgi:CRP/FNR family nitrogen fixation transcriptional regulator